MIDTKQKILDTAERLIGEQGYAATSLRNIISEAAVNLAAVHYHFGSKEDLLDEVICRKASTVNTKRLELLDRFEAEAGSAPVPVEKVLAAFFDPMIEAGSRNPQFVDVLPVIGDPIRQKMQLPAKFFRRSIAELVRPIFHS